MTPKEHQIIFDCIMKLRNNQVSIEGMLRHAVNETKKMQQEIDKNVSTKTLLLPGIDEIWEKFPPGEKNNDYRVEGVEWLRDLIEKQLLK